MKPTPLLLKFSHFSHRKVFIVCSVAVSLFMTLIIWGILHGTGALVRPLHTFGTSKFDSPMPIPPLVKGSESADGALQFNLILKSGRTAFLGGSETETWGINGNLLGPTIRVNNGQKVRFNINNSLPEASTIHWHGMHLPARMDGNPHQPIEPNTVWTPEWTVKQEAATLWYHPHLHGKTADHVYKGLAGMFIIDDDSTAAQSLPRTYGIDDIPVIVQDKQLDSSGQMVQPRDSSIGRLGNTIIVNGEPTPHIPVTTSYIRLRLLNASTARIYNFGLSNGNQLRVVASDGGMLEQAAIMDRLILSPGERAEVVIRLQPNELVSLRSYPTDLTQSSGDNRRIGAADSLDILQLRATASLADVSTIPDQLSSRDDHAMIRADVTRKFSLDSDQTINNLPMDMNRTDFRVNLGDTEIWEVTNTHNVPHSFHIHDVQFSILSIDGKHPQAHLHGRKDTVLLLPGQRVQLIMNFKDYADPSGLYMFHCHLLRHEDKGMMGQFTVVNANQKNRNDGTDTSGPHSH